MMMADAFGFVRYCSSTCPGSYHDQTVLETTKLYERYHVKKQLPFENAIVLGDSAYKRSWNWLLTPFLEGLVVGKMPVLRNVVFIPVIVTAVTNNLCCKEIFGYSIGTY